MPQSYTVPPSMDAESMGRSAGNWTVAPDSATLNEAHGAIAFRFYARDLHLVMGSRDGMARSISAC